MPKTNDVAAGSAFAAVAAGPILLITLFVLTLQQRASDVIPVDPSNIPAAVMTLIMSAAIGAMIAFPICMVLGSILAGLGRHHPIVRSGALWLLVAGGLTSALITALGFDLASEAMAFPLTAILCAAIVRARLVWD